MGDVRYVSATEVWAGIRAIQAEQAAGTISTADATRRIEACRRAVTARDLWKASGGKAGSPDGTAHPTGRLGRLVGHLVDSLQTLIRW